jgi:uncharacterized protein
MEPVISVRGEVTLEGEPEIAVLTAVARARDRDRQTVLAQLAARNQQMTELARGHGEAVQKLESGPAIVHPELKDKRRVGVYLGSVSLMITVRDFSVLGELMAGLAETELTDVLGPRWELRPDSPLYRQARLAAAADAKLRASEYAEAFGGRLGELIEVADTGLLTEQGGQAPRFRATAAGGMTARGGRALMSAGEPAELDFEPARQLVTARVEARFGMLA